MYFGVAAVNDISDSSPTYPKRPNRKVLMPLHRPEGIIFILVIILAVACVSDRSSPIAGHSNAAESASSQKLQELPLWRYVNSGWISPLDQQSISAFSKELRADVITSASELEEFNRTVINKRTRGTGATLNRADFPGSVVLVAYLMWMPMQGDPLSVIEIEINGRHVVVNLELDKDPQGRGYPYLFAPMTMVALDRSEFPAGGLVSFDFVLDNELQLTLKDDLR